MLAEKGRFLSCCCCCNRHSTEQRLKCVIFGSKCALGLIIIVDRVIDQTRDLLSQIFEGSIWAYQ